MDARVGELEVTYSARGIERFSIEVWHDGLNKHRVIRGDDDQIVQRKVELQLAEWEERWRVVDSREKDRSTRADGKRHQDNQKASAITKTNDAQKELECLASLLKQSVETDDSIDWETLKDRRAFPEPMPALGKLPPPPIDLVLPAEPRPGDSTYVPRLGLLDKLISSRKERRIAEAKILFDTNHAKWKETVSSLRNAHFRGVQKYSELVEQCKKQHASDTGAWEKLKSEFTDKQNAGNAAIDAKCASYVNAVPEAIVEYCDLVLSNSNYPDYFPKEFDLQYDVGALTLIVDYVLPPPEALPTVKAVKYIANRDEFESQHLSDAQVAKQYDDILYQVVLRTVHEILEADKIAAIKAVVFNGIVTSINRSTGKHVTACILSLRAGREEFLDIDLSKVDPKTCFKALKGVGSSKLHGLSPVPPIMQMRREDGRFVSAYEVANTLDESLNLAAMDWEDFEHLIREVFEKEFSASGGEVKVTRASRDGGVDAIAFDPDPIRGGKIVIQAKRYNNTVGVGAVRDLYGTVLNEGATKGVLVTTSDYGPDSYAFANGKPLVLLNGANLLHMLEKHGHRARIDLHEAKKIA